MAIPGERQRYLIVPLDADALFFGAVLGASNDWPLLRGVTRDPISYDPTLKKEQLSSTGVEVQGWLVRGGEPSVDDLRGNECALAIPLERGQLADTPAGASGQLTLSPRDALDSVIYVADSPKGSNHTLVEGLLNEYFVSDRYLPGALVEEKRGKVRHFKTVPSHSYSVSNDGQSYLHTSDGDEVGRIVGEGDSLRFVPGKEESQARFPGPAVMRQYLRRLPLSISDITTQARRYAGALAKREAPVITKKRWRSNDTRSVSSRPDPSQGGNKVLQVGRTTVKKIWARLTAPNGEEVPVTITRRGTKIAAEGLFHLGGDIHAIRDDVVRTAADQAMNSAGIKKGLTERTNVFTFGIKAKVHDQRRQPPPNRNKP